MNDNRPATVAALHRVDLNLLVALDALLAERNVTQAGRRLSLSQPAMSAALGRLRRLFDDQLLVRSGRQLEPTPFAEALAEPIREILAGVEQILAQRLHFDPASDARTFSVIASDYATVVLLRPLFEYLAEHAPRVRVAVAPLDPDFQERLRRDEVDLLVVPREVADKVAGLPSTTLFSDRFVCAVWRDHPAVGTSITVAQLSALPYLTYGAGALSSFVDIQLDALGITRQVEVTTQSFVIAPFLLRGTRFVAMVQERLGAEVAAAAGIRLLDPPVALRPITEAMFWHPRHDNDPGHRWLRAQIAKLAAELGDTPTQRWDLRARCLQSETTISQIPGPALASEYVRFTHHAPAPRGDGRSRLERRDSVLRGHLGPQAGRRRRWHRVLCRRGQPRAVRAAGSGGGRQAPRSHRVRRR